MLFFIIFYNTSLVTSTIYDSEETEDDDNDEGDDIVEEVDSSNENVARKLLACSTPPPPSDTSTKSTDMLNESLDDEVDLSSNHPKPLTTSNMHIDCMLPGFRAFTCFGVIAPKHHQLGILSSSAPEEKKSLSRSKKRGDAMKEAFDERERNIGNPNNPAGLKMADRVALGDLKRQH